MKFENNSYYIFFILHKKKFGTSFAGKLKYLKIGPVSLAQLIGHCMIYAGDRDSNPDHLTYPSYGWNF
jgi:hypothetical protein